MLLLVAAVAASTADASSIVSTRDVSSVRIGVNAKGEAMVSYVQHGKTVHVLAWGAENAVPPTPGGKQVKFDYDYSGGYKEFQPEIQQAVAQLRELQAAFALALESSFDSPGFKRGVEFLVAHVPPGDWKSSADPMRMYLEDPGPNQFQEQGSAAATAKVRANLLEVRKAVIPAVYKAIAALREQATGYWKTFTCPRYTGPALAFAVAACDAPDGSYWAVQQWQRGLPDYGVTPTPRQAADEIHLSHWTGALPVLTVETDWSYHKWQHLFGTFSYDDHPVYGFRSTHGGKPLDTFGRNVYLDSFDSDYGGDGWQRVNSWLTHKTTGAWCYGVSPHGAKNLTGAGSKYRLTVMGPGVTPDLSVVVPSPGPYDATVDAAQNAKIAALNDNLCKPN